MECEKLVGRDQTKSGMNGVTRRKYFPGIRFLTCWKFDEKYSGLVRIRNGREAANLTHRLVAEQPVVVHLHFAVA